MLPQLICLASCLFPEHLLAFLSAPGVFYALSFQLLGCGQQFLLGYEQLSLKILISKVGIIVVPTLQYCYKD